MGKKINSIDKLEVGDYVVHRDSGIGVYMGITTIEKNGLLKDYILIKYKGDDKLYLPVDKVDKLYKYSSKDGAKPVIHKLNSVEWEKTKIRVKAKVRDMADKLLRLYAEREKKSGYAFSPDSEMMIEFENDFPYELTKDQITAIQQIKMDMEKPVPMDRLLCGDVGFGKTEVAFVAAFKAIMDSKQVLFLCPTTILSNQHYENAKERFKNFPVSILIFFTLLSDILTTTLPLFFNIKYMFFITFSISLKYLATIYAFLGSIALSCCIFSFIS